MFASAIDLQLPDFPMALSRETSIPDVVDMYDNDKIGDCTCASIGYLENVWTDYGRSARLLTRDEIVSFYTDVTGYTPGDPSTDNGASMLDVLKRWRKIGVGTDNRKITMFVKIDHDNVDHVKSAINLFGGVYVGAMLPLSAKTAVENGQSWINVDDASGSWGGHCMSASRYDRSGVWLRTWGKSQNASWQWWSKYVDECYGVLSAEWRQPNELDTGKLEQLLSLL